MTPTRGSRRARRIPRGHRGPDPDGHQHRPAIDQNRPQRCHHRHYPL